MLNYNILIHNFPFFFQPEEEPLSAEMFEQMVWLPENLPQNIFAKINTYKNILLRQLEAS